MRIVAIIQARMGSTRLPGKVLMDIGGKTMLAHVVDRTRRAKLLDKILVATTLNPHDERIIVECDRLGVLVFRGREEDVLDRYYQVAREYKADVIVRITSDCPLIDPEVIDTVVRYYLENRSKLDYVSNTLTRSYPRGLDVEVFPFNILERTWREAREAYQREHVTLYIYEHPEIFRLANVKNSEDLSYLRWTVDEEKDLEFVREVYKRLYKEDEVFLMQDILYLLKREPQLLEINKEIKQRKLGE